jgi:hypothetical protein
VNGKAHSGEMTAHAGCMFLQARKICRSRPRLSSSGGKLLEESSLLLP